MGPKTQHVFPHALKPLFCIQFVAEAFQCEENICLLKEHTLCGCVIVIGWLVFFFSHSITDDDSVPNACD